jgi:hypothetical protein
MPSKNLSFVVLVAGFAGNQNHKISEKVKPFPNARRVSRVNKILKRRDLCNASMEK